MNKNDVAPNKITESLNRRGWVSCDSGLTFCSPYDLKDYPWVQAVQIEISLVRELDTELEKPYK